MEKTITGLVLLAAGSGTRMQADKNKVLMSLKGKPLFLHALDAFAQSGVITEAVIVCREREERELAAHIPALPFTLSFAHGGETRQDSVFNGLSALSASVTHVMVHDSARPYISVQTIQSCQQALEEHGSGVVGVFSNDTIKHVENGEITKTLDRTQLVNIQTPQCFKKETLLKAHAAAQLSGYIGTDESVLVERLGLPVHFVAGEYSNIKVTTPADLPNKRIQMKIGHGMDVHAFAENRKLILGGVTIPHTKGLAGHSDADVLTHAIMDALLGAAGLPDIGQNFPDTDPAFKDADSIALLREVGEKLNALSLSVGNIDATLAMQAPKVGAYIADMRKNIAAALDIAVENINIKATTTERLGFVGRNEGVVCHAVCLIG